MLDKKTIIIILCAFTVLVVFTVLSVVNIGELLSAFLPSQIKQNPLVVLFVGVDEKIENTVRTDVILIGVIDHMRKHVVLTNVPRDLLVDGGKINSVYQRQGIKGLSDLLAGMLEMEINRYVVLDYQVFKQLGDRLGPVEIVVKEPMHYEDSAQKLSIHFEPGVHKMNGEQLLAYIRYRKDAMGDIARIERQREVLTKLATKATSLDFVSLLRIAGETLENVKTDMKFGEILYLGLRFRKNLSMNFVNFPYSITEKGDVIVDKAKLKLFKEQVSTESSSSQQNSVLSLLILNSTSEKSRDFLVRTLNLWTRAVNFAPSLVIWEDIGINYQKDTVLILNSAEKTVIVDTLKKVYPSKDFEVKNFSADLISEYLTIVDKASKNRIYLRGTIDAVVVISR